jgi:extracellular elastinolytic metalloproteinase
MVAAGAVALATFGGAAPGAVAGGRVSAGLRPAAHPAAGGPATGYDARTAGTAVAVGSRIAKARVSLARSLGTLGVLQSDPVTGTLRYVGRLDGFLTEASGAPASRIALRYVRANRTAFGLRLADLKTLRLRDDYVDALGTHHLSWIQRAGGLTVFGQGLRANVAKDGRLINVVGGPMRGLRAPTTTARMSAAGAIASARRAVSSSGADARDTAALALFPTGRGARLAWMTTTYVSPAETDLSLVDALSGAILYRDNLTDAGAPAVQTGTAEAWEYYPSDIATGGSGTAQSVTFPVFDGSALFGPNAWVFKDTKDDSYPDPGDDVPASDGVLDWSDYSAPLDTTTTNQNCSTSVACTWDKNVGFSWKANTKHDAVQVYYFLNRFHDHLAAAPISFTDAAGNFEYGGTGGHDPVLGNASDGANTGGGGFPDLGHVDNANMTTPPDGTPPTMQMYLFRKLNRFGLPNVASANGGDDAEVVYHEYTHGLSNRLVLYPGGNSGLDNQQANSMGEGWSDWYALDFLVGAGYKPNPAGDGNLVMGALSFGGDLRTQPIDCPVGSPSPNCPGTPDAGPGGYTYGDFGLIGGGPEVHADGEIWVETLWDLRRDLGRNTTEELVTRGMELSPPSPSYLDMRNAILQADLVANGGANEAAIWNVFANRGMGYFASSLGGGDVHPVEDFSPPADCAVVTCNTVSGTVTDKATGAPVEGVTVGIAGLDSGFATSLSDVSAADGTYAIASVPQHDAYAALNFRGGGYEPDAVTDLVVNGDETVDNALNRDWASLEGGATLRKYTPPDYADFCGSNANGAFDLNLGNGWPSDSPRNDSSGVGGARKATVELPKNVDVTSFGVASGGACGDGPDSAVKKFEIWTRTGKGDWRKAVTASAPSNGRLKTYVPAKGTQNVRFVRFVMVSNHGNRAFMDVLEVSVRGT